MSRKIPAQPNRGKIDIKSDRAEILTAQGTAEPLVTKDLLRQDPDRATIENRLVQIESQHDALVTDRRTLHDALQTLQEQHATQDEVATQFQAQLRVLMMEQRTLHEAIQMLREQLIQQRMAPAQISQSYSGITGHSGKPAVNAVNEKKQSLSYPVGMNLMTAEEKTLFEGELDRAIKAGGVPALETLLKKQVAGRSLQYVASCRLKAASAALANGYVA